MSIQKTEAILLRKQDLRETSLILTFYTRDFGKIRGIARGVRGPRQSAAGGSYEILSLDEIVFYERKRGDIFTVSQCDLVDYFNIIRSDLTRLSYAAYMAELLDSVTSLSDPNPEVFRLGLDSFRLLSEGASPRRVARLFEIKLLSLIGMMPELELCASCGGVLGEGGSRFSFKNGGLICARCSTSEKTSSPILPGSVKFLSYVQSSPFDKASKIKVAEAVGREVEAILRKFLDYHVERRMRSVAFIKSIGG